MDTQSSKKKRKKYNGAEPTDLMNFRNIYSNGNNPKVL